MATSEWLKSVQRDLPCFQEPRRYKDKANKENQALIYLLTIGFLTNVRRDSQLPCGSAGSKTCHGSRYLRLDNNVRSLSGNRDVDRKDRIASANIK